MKKLLALILIVCSLFALTSCGAETYELAIGVAVTAPTGDALTVTETVAALILDEDGKIVACRLDTLQAKIQPDQDGVVSDTSYKTKGELGYDYGMKDYAKTNEWFEQARAFEAYLVGKTLADVEGIDTTKTDLVAGCTIGLGEFVPAVVAAFKDAHKVSFESKDVPTLGVAVSNKTADKSADDKNKVQLVADFGAVAMVDGKVVAATLDCADATLTYEATEEGYTCTDFAFKGTKRAQGYGYGMKDYAQSGEWFEQAQAYANSAVGKTASEVASLATNGVAGCTIGAGDMQKALDKAAQNVR